MLDDLQLGEFIYEQPAVGDVEYIFKHALTQEVAYNSVLTERRQLLHERTGAALEALFAASSTITWRAGASLRPQRQRRQGGRVPERAGRQSGRTLRLRRGCEPFQRRARTASGDAESPQRAERELALLRALGPAVLGHKGLERARGRNRLRARARTGREPARPPQLFPAPLVGRVLRRWGRLPACPGIRGPVSDLAERKGDSDMLVQAYHQLGWLQTYAEICRRRAILRTN